MMRRVCLVALLAATGVTYACKPRQERSSELRDLNQPSAMNDQKKPTAAMRAKKQKVVVVYYANDGYSPNSDDPAYVNLQAVVRTLRAAVDSEPDPQEQQRFNILAEKLETEWARLSGSIRNDVAALTKVLCQKVPAAYRDTVAGLAVFRNFDNESSLNAGSDYMSRSIRTLKYTVCRPENPDRSENFSFELPRNESFPFLSQPLSHPLAFQRALESLRSPQLFPPANHRYILITKSHGSDEIAIAPHFSVDMVDYLETPQGQADFIKAVKAKKTIGGLEKMGGDPILSDMDDVLKQTRPQAAADVGVSKSDFVQILRDLSMGDATQNMNFPIVLMQSCRSDLRYATKGDVNWVLSTSPFPNTKPAPAGQKETPPDYKPFGMLNLGWIYTSDRNGLGYESIVYNELTSMRYQMQPDFEDNFKQFLDAITAGAPTPN